LLNTKTFSKLTQAFNFFAKIFPQSAAAKGKFRKKLELSDMILKKF